MSSIWIPLRKLMAKARNHRNSEIRRLQHHPQEAAQLEMQDQLAPQPSSTGPTDEIHGTGYYLARWRQLVSTPPQQPVNTDMSHPGAQWGGSGDPPPSSAAGAIQQPALGLTDMTHSGPQAPPLSLSDGGAPPSLETGFGHWLWTDAGADASVDMFSNLGMEPIDVDTESDGTMDWNSWVESAIDMERSARMNAGANFQDM